MMKRHLVCGVLTLAVLLFCVGSASAATSDQGTANSKNDISIYLNGEPLRFDVAPIVVNGRTMVPFRAIFEPLGYTVEWDAASQTVTAHKEEFILSLQIGNPAIRHGAEVFESDAAPMIQMSRTLVPVRAVSELSGYDVLWEQDANAVFLYHRQPPPARFTYSEMVSDGLNLYTADWSAGTTIQVSLSDLSVKKLFPYCANDYFVYGGKLYGRYGLSTRLSYGAYNLATGELEDVTGTDVASCYIDQNQLYFEYLEWGPYKTTLNRMNLNGGNAVKVLDGSAAHPIGTYAILNNILFSHYIETAFVMPLDSQEPLDLIKYCGLDRASTFVNAMAVQGDCLYAALSRYAGEAYDLTPMGILQFNYRTREYHMIAMDACIEDLVVTDDSIYYSKSGEKAHNIYDIYRCDLTGENSTLVVKDIYHGWILSGDYLYGTAPHTSSQSALIRVATDGSQYQVITTMDIYNGS